MKLQSINPHDQSVVGELEISTKADVKAAVEKARNAFWSWRFIPIEERVEYIKKFRNKIVENKEKIAKLTTLEMGKPIQQSLSDVDWELSFIDYYIEKGPIFLSDETVREKGKEHFRITYEPYGVCACIAPWNFPLSMANSGILPALIAGNTVIFKPSEYTSLSQKIVIDLLNEAGLPEEVANIVIGAGIGGKQPDREELARGNYFEPTVLTNVTTNMRVFKEEVFGPVLPIIPFERETEAIELANNTEYGLSAEVYTTDIARGERVAKQLQAGTVAINTDDFFKPECPFGGYKKSGMGREYGEIGMKEFAQVKLLAVVKL